MIDLSVIVGEDESALSVQARLEEMHRLGWRGACLVSYQHAWMVWSALAAHCCLTNSNAAQSKCVYRSFLKDASCSPSGACLIQAIASCT